jgi:preprotein translocase subunit SecG
MALLAASSFLHFLFGTLMLLISLFLILLVLVQRGRGGGLTGALGGAGGQSAFGTKAGDTFTRITYGAAIVWICVCMLAIKVLHVSDKDLLGRGGSSTPTVEADPYGKSKAGDDNGTSSATEKSSEPAPKSGKTATDKAEK